MSVEEVAVPPQVPDEKVRRDAANPNSHGVGTLVLNPDGGSQTIKIAYFPESLAYYNGSEKSK